MVFLAFNTCIHNYNVNTILRGRKWNEIEVLSKFKHYYDHHVSTPNWSWMGKEESKADTYVLEKMRKEMNYFCISWWVMFEWRKGSQSHWANLKNFSIICILYILFSLFSFHSTQTDITRSKYLNGLACNWANM